MTKTKELIGDALDWAVATAMKCPPPYFNDKGRAAPFSTNWAQGGPIIERETIELTHAQRFAKRGIWGAFIKINTKNFLYHAPTPLIAAMRCFVASKLGDEVEIPEELL